MPVLGVRTASAYYCSHAVSEIFCSTGMKCLPAIKLPASKGVGLHDWHAEILALRGLNRYLLDECNRVLNGDASPFVERASSSLPGQEVDEEVSPFRIADGVKLHMYCSEAPCT